MIVVLVGPTAVGKSALALGLAARWATSNRPAEIVNVDSMAVYRGMDIGTAKPSAAERTQVRHHLVDVWDIERPATVAEFQGLARAAIADVQGRDRVPLLVGGSALYVRAVVDDFTFPGTDPERRAALEAELIRLGPTRLHELLATRDPVAAGRIEPGNGRRVVRALEVLELTGRPYAATLPTMRYALPGVVTIGLSVDRPTLDARIEERVDRMWQEGFVDEVAGLAHRGLRDARTASRALGYRQVLAYLDGELTEDEARRQTIQATRRFARRQERWFRQDPRIAWLRHDRPDLIEATLAVLDGGSPRSAVGG